MEADGSSTSTQVFQVENDVATASILDDSYWRSITVNSENGTVCSYQLLNGDSETKNNVFEIQLSGLENAQIGLYYGQYAYSGSDEAEYFDVTFEAPNAASSATLEQQISEYSRLIDMKIFSPD